MFYFKYKGPEEEALNDSINSPPCTVRERQEETQESTSNNLSRQPSPEKICCKFKLTF